MDGGGGSGETLGAAAAAGKDGDLLLSADGLSCSGGCACSLEHGRNSSLQWEEATIHRNKFEYMYVHVHVGQVLQSYLKAGIISG